MTGHSSGLNVILSYGDLSCQSGYRTRVLGELQHLDATYGPEPFLLLFDRNPAAFETEGPANVRFRAQPRSAMTRFYPEIARLSREGPVRVVHAHNLYSAALALSARRFYGYKVVLDYHGRIPEEYVFLGKGGEPSRKALEQLERWSVRNADHVIVVSERLAEYLSDRYEVPRSKVSVIPCCSDASAFRWDPSRRNAARADLGLSDKLVCTHLGSFFEWYEPELLVRLFRQIQSREPSAHLLVVTSPKEPVREYIAAHFHPDSFTIISALHDQVPPLLNASDLGFLLLRPAPNIKTSSPAKFSEYLNCGLPVLITPDVGDFSELVQKHGAGLVVTDTSDVPPDFLADLKQSRDDVANRCVEAGRSLTWQACKTTWERLLTLVL